jgi:hypothetical protein
MMCMTPRATHSHQPDADVQAISTCRTVDQSSRNGIEKVDFIKMDIEGAEREALEGAKPSSVLSEMAICTYHRHTPGRAVGGAHRRPLPIHARTAVAHKQAQPKVLFFREGTRAQRPQRLTNRTPSPVRLIHK